MSGNQRTEECYVCTEIFPTTEGRYFRQYGELVGWCCWDCLPQIRPDCGELPEPEPKPVATTTHYKFPYKSTAKVKRPWTKAEDEELQALADETLNGRRVKGWRDHPRGRYYIFSVRHGRTLAAVKMRAKRLGAKSYLKW